MTKIPFEIQIDRYVAMGFAGAAGLTPNQFTAKLEPVREVFGSAPESEFSPIVVLRREFVTGEQLVAAIDRTDGKPQTVIGPPELTEYRQREGVELPGGIAYVVHGISKEPATRGVAPSDALELIGDAGRSPLTIEEGLAIWHQIPDVIAVNDGISLAGSTRGDKRVPALWISKQQPKLGWCFSGVPHSWLATASCVGRLGVN